MKDCRWEILMWNQRPEQDLVYLVPLREMHLKESGERTSRDV